MRIGLVACSGRKLDHEAPARELYGASQLFRKAAAYCEATHGRWYVLSAKHGLVKPDQTIAPYDQTLMQLTRPQRRQWAERVQDQLIAEVGLRSGATFVFYAGVLYRHDLASLIDLFDGEGSVEVPLRGLRIGEQLRFYKERGY